MNFNIGDRQIGDDFPCYITFEAGPTHDGLETALKLVRQAAEAGADAVKFQLFDLDRLVPDRKQPFTYSILVDRATGKMEEVTEPLYDILLRRHLKREDWVPLKRECDKLGLAFFSTAAFPEEIDFLVKLGCHSIKIASGDVNHHPLIRYAAKTGLCLQLDTGGSTLGEVEAAVDVILKEGNSNIIIHQCPSGYPARLESINLRIIQTLKQMFRFPAAFSDHTPGWEMDIAAVALGANMVEKTITLDRTTRSVEHSFSLEKEDMPKFVRAIRELETALGKTRRIMGEEERAKRLGARRSCFLAKDIKAGDVITEDMIDYRRPGKGIAPNDAKALIGARMRRDKQAGAIFEWKDLE
ncbi:MAG TPA: N-acetylneuraminate synthase family protein [Fibrobacteria bacterium]|nr:N-acetylneuraminate synthase family protein [Fibrobacteria bacterium]